MPAAVLRVPLVFQPQQLQVAGAHGLGNGDVALEKLVARALRRAVLKAHPATEARETERLGVEGFTAVGVYRSLQPDVRRYFIRYDLTTPAVLVSEAYLARLNAPTPWTRAAG